MLMRIYRSPRGPTIISLISGGLTVLIWAVLFFAVGMESDRSILLAMLATCLVGAVVLWERH